MIIIHLLAELVSSIFLAIAFYLVVLPVLLLFSTPVILVVAAFSGSRYWSTVFRMYGTELREIAILFLGSPLF
jgi:hypothetical protein